MSAKGRRRLTSGKFAMLPERVLESEAVRTLSHAAFRVLVLLTKAYNGRNNGALGLTVAQAKREGIGSDNTLYSALRTLEERGLIQRTASPSRVPPRPAMYLLTWQPVNDTEYSRQRNVPAHSYQQWRAAA
ncbi:MAG: PadR family transcriptional regulator [Gammaproteobacteria bacterium]|nr:PadR family transcriptional regulator [Gammaproteobacteria bacterium]